METIQFKFNDQIASFENYLDFYLKNKSRDCILFSEDGSKFKVHKELFGQTDFLREILSSTKDQCCGTIEVSCPCSKDELSSLVNFLCDGEIHCEEESESLKIIENLQNIFGFQRNLVLNYYPNEAFFTSDNNIEVITLTEEVLENILDNTDPDDIVIIPPRSKDLSDNLVAIDQGKEDQGDGKVSEKKKTQKKISLKKVKRSSIKKCKNQFKCNDCGSSFIFKVHLQRHINAIHLKLKPYECDQCKMSFAQKSQLDTHVKIIHQEIKAHKCKYCQLHFARKHGMQTHVNMLHLKIRPFKCDQCNKTFTQQCDLNSHIQSNCKKLKNKGFKCGECDRSFVTSNYLKLHMNRVHLKIKPLRKVVCNECEESFEHKQSLEYHINRIHLKVKPYLCDFCKKAFHLGPNLKKHLKRTHNDEAN